ncbi:MlaE family ABC transporter permease [Sulfurimonas paralvinellae]|uniref:ABC transporter permease n=1 Tax=Sulfurimonas paralvinellae TaxID=317658 RepID=A0A7M1B662_9BACT|nr:ABC transporter permease [Sulfurimonas paralvinellae]QOP45204.1 ABC transporter permease [Sulfurimonas paralvinellae]
MYIKPLIDLQDTKLSITFNGDLSLATIATIQKEIAKIKTYSFEEITLNFQSIDFLDTAGGIFIYELQKYFKDKGISVSTVLKDELQKSTLELVTSNMQRSSQLPQKKEESFLEVTGRLFYEYYIGFISFLQFFGELFVTNIRSMTSLKNIRFKEIAFEINESAIKALGIIALTSFLIGLVVAYQSAYQLKIYGANIFIVDMLGLSIFRELSPLITAIVIAGRSGSAYAAQIGAMKITQELDAMKTMGFEPFAFLVLPRIIALVIMMPILIFVSDMMAMFGGLIVANLDLHITPELFIDRFREVIAAKHFYVGIVKGPFFAFLIASIGIYRGLMVKDDTQSIGFNTTKSVVESIFAVIVCDAVFSIAFTNLGI